MFGRGACDAKGILAAQVAAADRLPARGRARVGLLFVVGEERGSDGARAANLAAQGSRFLIDGEPTDSRLGHRHARCSTRQAARHRARAHSSFPELGESAIDKLIDALVELRSIRLPADPVLGSTHYTVGLIAGGIAPNVVSPSAEAEVMFRTVNEAADLGRAIATLERRVAVEHILEVPPVRLTTVPGFETAVFPYTTDIPFLSRWGQALLFGPGFDPRGAHRRGIIDIAELGAAVGSYVALARQLLARA